MTPSAVLLDLDDTLCRYRRDPDEVLADAFDRAGVDPFFTVDDFERWIPKVEASSPLDLREQCFAGIAREQGRDPALAREVAAAYEPRDPANVEFRPGAERALRTLGERYPLGLVTNGGEDRQSAKLRSLGIADAFDATVFATPESAVKPDPEPLERACSALGVAPREAVHVGDSLASDVAGARAAGIASVWVPDGPADRGEADPTPEYVVDSPRALASDPLPWHRDR